MKEKLLADKKLLEKQLAWIEISFNECVKIGIKKQYSVDEFGRFETLCSRYSRGIDFLIRKIFRTLDEYEFENQGTLVDVVNNAHKRGLFDDLDELRVMKDVRNTIAHEYIEDELVEVFDEVLSYTEKLVQIIHNTLDYIQVNYLDTK
jgi:2-hydroxy-3-keto-5-methylthiopentenyl-1-phosphate phosphatase